MFDSIREVRRLALSMPLTERVGLLLLLLLIVAAPLPYGGIMPAGVLRIQLLCFVAAAFALAANRGAPPLPLLPVVAVAGIAALGAIQLIPFPPQVVSALSPTSATVYAGVNRALALAGEGPVPSRISIAPFETFRAALLVLAYAFAFLAAVRLTRRRWQRTALMGVLLVNASAHVIYAAVTQGDEPRMHGTFVNPNHFAGYLQIALAFAFSMLWIEIVTATRGPKGPDAGDHLEKRVLGLSWRLLIWAGIAVAIGMSMSRMGIAAAAAGSALALAMALAHSRSRRTRRRAMIAFGVLACGVAIVFATAGSALFVRFLASDPRDPQSDLRFLLWQISYQAWKQFPHLGAGLGAFREAFRRVQVDDFGGVIEQAHNDALQLLVTGGWIALALAVVALGTLAFRMVRRWWDMRRRHEAAFGQAALVALAALLIHGVAEFNFSIPAIPATLAVMLGAGWSALNAQLEDEP